MGVQRAQVDDVALPRELLPVGVGELRGARVLITIQCEHHEDNVTTPDTVRLPIDSLCVVTFTKDGYREEVTEFDPAEYAHISTLDPDPDCGDPAVWCDPADSFGRIVFNSLFLGTSGLIARAFDPIRRGRGEIGAVLMPHGDNGSDSAQPGG